MQQLESLTLNKLMSLHDQTATCYGALADSFLEGYFLSISPIARKVRQVFLNKFSFTSVSTAKNISYYYQNSIFILPELFYKGTVYYTNQTDPLKKVISENKPVGNLFGLSFQNLLVSNKLLHESLHLLFFEDLFKDKLSFKYSEAYSPANESDWILKHLATESAVLALELLASLVEYRSENLWTTKIHTHQHAESQIEFETLGVLISKYGIEVVFEMLVKIFNFKNLRPHDSDDLCLIRLLKIHSSPIFLESDFINLFNMVYLGSVFRRYSNGRYFYSLGFLKPYTEWLDLQDSEALINSATVQRIIDLGLNYI